MHRHRKQERAALLATTVLVLGLTACGAGSDDTGTADAGSDATAATPTTDAGSDPTATDPAGTEVLVAGRDTGGDVDLAVVGADGSNQGTLAPSAGFDACPSIATDGAVWFCSDRSGSFEVWATTPDGGEPRQVTDHGGYLVFPEPSPDGARVLMFGTSDPDGAEEDFELWVADADGSGLEPLTDTPGPDMAPTWSPDGTQIAWVSSRSGSPEIWVMRADGTDPRQVTHDGRPKDGTDWSPDGSQIAYSADDDIQVVSVDGGEPTALTAAGSLEYGPAWSPDGSRIAFLTEGQDGAELWTMAADGSGPEPLTSGGGFYFPDWGTIPAP